MSTLAEKLGTVCGDENQGRAVQGSNIFVLADAS
jgi:hypothetical protein